MIFGIGPKKSVLIAAYEDAITVSGQDDDEPSIAHRSYKTLLPHKPDVDGYFKKPMHAPLNTHVHRVELWTDGPRIREAHGEGVSAEGPILWYASALQGPLSTCAQRMCQWNRKEATQPGNTPWRQALKAALIGLASAGIIAALGLAAGGLLTASGIASSSPWTLFAVGAATCVGIVLCLLRGGKMAIHRAWQTSIRNKEALDWSMLLRFADMMMVDRISLRRMDKEEPLAKARLTLPEPKSYTACLLMEQKLGHVAWPAWSREAPFFFEAKRELTPFIRELSGVFIFQIADRAPAKTAVDESNMERLVQWSTLALDPVRDGSRNDLWSFLKAEDSFGDFDSESQSSTDSDQTAKQRSDSE